ncbi:MAG: hypothetical protein H7A37_06740 [Chlamydiales bacterium]|nr:hypothetical protein [Chlamydiales bacterium]
MGACRHIEVKEVTARKTSLPKSSFSNRRKNYDAIGEPVLALTYVAPKMQLPDLRQFIVYYGQNGRPDADWTSHRFISLWLIPAT